MQNRIEINDEFLSKMIPVQVELEELYDKNELMPRLRRVFNESDTFNFSEMFAKLGVPHEFGVDLLVQMMLHRRTDPPTIFGVMRNRAETKTAQEAATYVVRCANAGLIHYDPVEDMFITSFNISPSLQADLDKFQYPMPMVVPPEKVECNLDVGYLTRKASIILKDNHHMEDVCLDHINRMNAVPLTINMDTVKMVKNQWRNLDKQKPDESLEDYQKRCKAFERYDQSSHQVIYTLAQYTSVIYMTHRYDKRGRCYSQGHHVNPQGNDWNKAVLEFAEEELITE